MNIVDLAGSEANYIGNNLVQQKNTAQTGKKKSLLNTPSPVKQRNVAKNGRSTWRINKAKSPMNQIDSERGLMSPSDSSDRSSAMMFGSPTNPKKSIKPQKGGKEKTYDVETEAKFINKNLTTLGRIF